VVVEPAAVSDARDHVVGTLGAQPVPALVEKQRRAVFRSRPVAALLEPVAKGLAQLGVDWDLPDSLPLGLPLRSVAPTDK
jgi:hypothetical protein